MSEEVLSDRGESPVTLRQAEQALRESERRMRMAIRASRMITWEWVPAEDRIRTSDNFADLYGSHALSGAEEGFRLVLPEDRDAHLAKVLAIADKGGTYNSEFRIRRPDNGEVTWLEERAEAQLGPDGRVERIIGVTLDITERRRAEEALRESERRLERELADTKRLQAISAMLIEREDDGAIYENIVDAAMRLMRSDAASVQMLDRDTQELRLLAWKGFHPESAAYWHRVTSQMGTMCGSALKRGERIIVTDVWKESYPEGSKSLDHFRLSGIRSVQSTPLVSRDGSVIGMISTHWQGRHVPQERDFAMFDVLARQAADVVERNLAVAALRDAHAELGKRAEETRQALLRQLASAEEEERRRISRELHDGLGQEITVLGLKLAALRGAAVGHAGLGEALVEIESLVSRISDDLDFVVWQLRPTMLDDLGLVEALGEYVKAWSHATQIDSTFDADHPASGIAPEMTANLFRIAQESLNNVSKHAKARHVHVAIANGDRELRLVIEDDGVGLAPAEPSRRKGFGLVGMRERAALFGGTVEIAPRPEGGTRVEVRLPL
jgi:PAS domain S-box-containing protein